MSIPGQPGPFGGHQPNRADRPTNPRPPPASSGVRTPDRRVLTRIDRSVDSMRVTELVLTEQAKQDLDTAGRLARLEPRHLSPKAPPHPSLPEHYGLQGLHPDTVANLALYDTEPDDDRRRAMFARATETMHRRPTRFGACLGVYLSGGLCFLAGFVFGGLLW